MSRALEVARSFEAAWQGRDFETARGYLAEGVVFESPFGRETSAEAMIGQFTGFAQTVTGPAREISAFGDDENALIMYVIPSSVFGDVVSAAHYVVRDGRITFETQVYDATTAKTMQLSSS
jgi:hypothetical protein